MIVRWSRILSAVMLLASGPAAVAAQRARVMPTADTTRPRGDAMATRRAAPLAGPLGIPMTRFGSGTSWLPDAAPMHAYAFAAGSWGFMAMGDIYVQYDHQGSERGDDQFGSINWGMLMAARQIRGGELLLRGMLSLEPWTVTGKGYPLLLQSGESFGGEPLHDRQHPHDLFMEIAASYDHALSRNLAFELYAGPVGEPALGPTAFPHRPSAMNDPLAPLGHHWQDATHISFGVATAGLYTRHVKLEGSIFNGREPDEIRTNFDFRRLDSYSGRVTINPSDRWSLSASYGFLASPEALHPDVSVHRVTVAVANDHPIGARGASSSLLIYGANTESDASRISNSMLAEANLNLDGTNSVFGRLEFVQKSARDLAVDQGPRLAIFPVPRADASFNIGAVVLGYAREIGAFDGGSIALGARGSVDVIPIALEPVYGTRTPAGFAVFLRFRPALMHMGTHAQPGMMHMPGMPMPDPPT